MVEEAFVVVVQTDDLPSVSRPDRGMASKHERLRACTGVIARAWERVSVASMVRAYVRAYGCVVGLGRSA